MAAITAAELEKRYGVAPGGLFTTAKPHFFQPGQIVWRKSENTAPLSNVNRKYKIVQPTEKYQDFAGTLKAVDSAGAAAVQATIAAAVQPNGTDSDKTCNWYTIQEFIGGVNGKVITGIHESDLMLEAAFETYYQTQVPSLVS